MTGPEHYRKAEALLEEATSIDGPPATEVAIMAQAHAMLALAAVTAHHMVATTGNDRQEWSEAIHGPAGVQLPTTTEADTVLAAAIPEWEAVYEPGNVSDYLIGYANSEVAAKGAAIAWVLSQSDKAADRLGWERQTWSNEHDAWFDLFERHDDGTETGVGVTVRHRVLPYTAADFTPDGDEQPAVPAAPEDPS